MFKVMQAPEQTREVSETCYFEMGRLDRNTMYCLGGISSCPCIAAVYKAPPCWDHLGLDGGVSYFSFSSWKCRKRGR